MFTIKRNFRRARWNLSTAIRSPSCEVAAEPGAGEEFHMLLRGSDPTFRRFLIFLKFTGAGPGEAANVRRSDVRFESTSPMRSTWRSRPCRVENARTDEDLPRTKLGISNTGVIGRAPRWTCVPTQRGRNKTRIASTDCRNRHQPNGSIGLLGGRYFL